MTWVSLAKSEGWSCSWSATAGALHLWTPDNQELADQCPRQTRPGTIPGSRIAEIPQGARAETVETVDCRQPHAGEVYAQLAVPDADFPGEDAIVEKYASRSEPELASYSPAAAQDMSIKD
jgi:hypothetical protein